MFDAFPYDEWSEEIADFWTFGGDGSTGTWILTIIGFVVFWIAMIAFVKLENRKLDAQRDALRSAGAFVIDDPEPPSSV